MTKKKKDTSIEEPIEIRLCNSEIELLLKALELYALNFHNFRFIDCDYDKQELHNALIFHTYHILLHSRSNYTSRYDVLKNCRSKKYYIYKNRKNEK